MAKKKTYYDYLRQELGELVEQLQLPDLYKQSLKQRWLDQTVWADKKSGECRRWHYRLRLTTIIGGVILPALVGINFEIGKNNPTLRTFFPYLPFALSQVIAVSAAIEEFCRFGDRWRDYRQMAEDLKAEGWQYLQLSGSYESTKTHMTGYPLFASRVENIIKNDVQNYISDLIKQQAQQEQEIEQILESAQTVTKDKTLFAPPEPPRPVGAMYATAGAVTGGYMPNGTPGMAMPAAPTGYMPTATAGTAMMVAPAQPGIGGMTAPVATAIAGAAGLLRTRQNTVFKLSPQPSESLPDSYKMAVNSGSTFGLQAYQEGGNNHLYVALNQGLGTEQRNVWYVYAPHIEILGQDGQPVTLAIATAAPTPPTAAPAASATVTAQNGTVQLAVPYLSQVDNSQNPFGSCNVTSIAMCLKYLGIQQTNSSKQFEDELQDWLEARGLDRHEPNALAQAVAGYGCQDNFSTSATLDQVKQWLAQGNPCVTHGYFTSSGHIVAIVGYNNQGLIVHDPYGKWTEGGYDRNDDSHPEKGKAVIYDYAMIQRTCMTDGQFWVHFISRPGHQPSAATAQSTPNLITAPGNVPNKLKNLLTITQNMANLLTADQLIQIAGANAPHDRLRELISSVNQTLERYQINTALRIAHFIAQVAHESDCFNAMEEYASGEDYEGRDDLGNTQPGDGVRFKGRGLIQLTGRSNYAAFAKAMNVDFIAQPTLVAQAPYAVLVAGWFWDNNQLNSLADQDDLRAVTRTINGGYNGLEDREKYLQVAKRVLQC